MWNAWSDILSDRLKWDNWVDYTRECNGSRVSQAAVGNRMYKQRVKSVGGSSRLKSENSEHRSRRITEDHWVRDTCDADHAKMSLVGDHSVATLEEIVRAGNAPATNVHGQVSSKTESVRVSGSDNRAVYVVWKWGTALAEKTQVFSGNASRQRSKEVLLRSSVTCRHPVAFRKVRKQTNHNNSFMLYKSFPSLSDKTLRDRWSTELKLLVWSHPSRVVRITLKYVCRFLPQFFPSVLV